MTGSNPAGGTGWARMAASLTASGALYENDAVLVSAHGIDGRAIELLDKGTVPYNNLLAAVTKAYLITRLLGKDYVAPNVVWVQGPGDISVGTFYASYKASLVQLQSDLDADIKAITGQAGAIVLVIDQVGWFSSGTTSPIPLAQLAAALENPTKIICAGPKYHHTYIDGVHVGSVGTADRGEEFDRSIEAGTAWKPLYPVSASRTGAVINVTFHVPEGSLALDTNTGQQSRKLRRRVEQTGKAAVTISSVAIASATELTVMLSEMPAGPGQKLKFAMPAATSAGAGPTTGPRSNIRDSATLVSDRGNPLYNMCCHSEVLIS